MMRSACVVLALVLGLESSRAAKIRSSNSLAREGELEAAWGRELDAGEVSPIKRVVTLLTDMKKQLESEAAKEAEMYEEVSCWCKTNKGEKTQEITDGEAKIAELEIGMQEGAAQKGKLGTQIGHLKEDIASAEESLRTARAIREKEKAEFNDVENEMMESITNLKNAIAILGRHQGGDASLLQLDNPVGVSFQKVLRDVALKYVELVVGRSSNLRSSAKASGAVLLDTGKKDLPKQLISALGGENLDVELPLDLAQRKLAVSARDAKPEAAFMQAKQPIFKSYSARSSGIYGILTQMLDEFEANLSQEQKDELSKRESFKALEASQTELIDTSKEKLDALEEEHSSVTKALSDTNEDLGLTTEQRSADVEFLRNMRLKCQDLDVEYAERSKTRAEELAAVSDAIAILTEDDARDLFAKSVPSFLQEAADTHHNSVASEAMRRSRVVASLRKAAADPMFSNDDFFSGLADSWRQKHTQASTSSPAVSTAKAQLATLAVSAQLDSFTKVKEAMDKMIAELKQQQKEEVENKDLCNKDFDENDKATFAKNSEKKDLETEIASLASMIETLTSEVEVATKEIADTKVAVKKASENREKENTEFQTTVSEQRATQAILKKALARLADFYKKKALLQRSSAASSGQQEPPVKFNAYKKNADASPTMNLLEQIIGDSETLEKEAITAEQEAQTTYETFVQDSNNIIKDLSTAVISKKKLIAESEGSKDAARASLGEATNELELLEQYKADLHYRCDFLLKNFDIRQHARMQEIEAIQSAKAILSGAA